MLNYKTVSIFPKVLLSKAKDRFSLEEKIHLTRPGFRWYVYFSFRDPKTNKFKRQKPIYLNINRDFPEFDDRLREIKLMRKGIKQALETGYNPYNEKREDNYTIISSLEFALDIKKNQVESVTTYNGYKKSVHKFIDWLKMRGFANYDLIKCSQKMVIEFLDYISKTASNRTRNNYRSDLSAVFTILAKKELINKNFIKNIDKIKTKEKRDPTYTDEQVETIINELKSREDQKPLLMFIYFVSFLFWRPKENCRLRVKDINLKEGLITTPTKAAGTKTKKIPSVLLEDLKKYLKGAAPEDFVFTPNGPGAWSANLDNRRNRFSALYREFKKELKIEAEYNIYSFRHTFVTRAFKNLRKTLSKDKALEELANITGHNSKAIKEYIHYIDADVSEDYSDLLK